MNHHIRKNNIAANLESAFIYFILIQPLLDVLAYFGLPVSMIFRVGAMGVGFFYLILKSNTKVKKVTIIYLAILAVFMTVHLVINYMITDEFLMAQELTYVIKTVFFIVMMIIYLFELRSFSTRVNWQSKIQFYSFINMVFIAMIILVATITESGKRSYGSLAKEGHSGWFYSGNELSIILGMGFSIVILYIVSQKSLTKKLTLYPASGLIIWSMLMVGTKVGLGSIIITLLIGLVVFLLKMMNDKKYLLNVVLLVLLLTFTIPVIPFTPVGNNLNITFGLDMKETQTRDSLDSQSETVQEEPNLLSGRSDFLTKLQEQYTAAPFIQKIFGMGYAGNYKKSPKLIEMDFYDWYYSFGALGFTLLVIPILYIGYIIIRNLLRFHMGRIDTSVVFSGVSVCLGFGAAALAGHVLSSPAASFYLAVYIGYLFAVSQRSTHAANK